MKSEHMNPKLQMLKCHYFMYGDMRAMFAVLN